MTAKLLSYVDISQIIGLSESTMRTYLGSYVFSNHRRRFKYDNHIKDVYLFNKKFAYLLSEFLMARRKIKEVRNLEVYCERLEKKNGK